MLACVAIGGLPLLCLDEASSAEPDEHAETAMTMAVTTAASFTTAQTSQGCSRLGTARFAAL
jgi:hypothetical protein